MKYLTTTEVAEKWNISDRRVRVLCKEGRIPGIKEENGSYMIPFDAVKFRIAPCSSILMCIEGGSAGRKIAFTDYEVWNCQEMYSRRIPKILDRQESGGVMSQPC